MKRVTITLTVIIAVSTAILIFSAAAAFISLRRFESETVREIEVMRSQAKESGTTVTSEMIEDLPEPVKRWLSGSGIIGRKTISAMYLKQKGLLRLRPEQEKWISAEAVQYFDALNPSFIWKVRTSMSSIPVAGRDLFKEGRGEMLIKLAGIIPVVNISLSPELDQSTLQRYLGEIVWFPSAALSPYITWEPVDYYSAKATMSYKGTEGSAVFDFNDDGDLIRFTAFRYMDINDTSPTEWRAVVRETGTVEGIRIPVKLEAVWVLDEKEFTWYRFEIFDAVYY